MFLEAEQVVVEEVPRVLVTIENQGAESVWIALIVALIALAGTVFATLHTSKKNRALTIEKASVEEVQKLYMEVWEAVRDFPCESLEWMYKNGYIYGQAIADYVMGLESDLRNVETGEDEIETKKNELRIEFTIKHAQIVFNYIDTCSDKLKDLSLRIDLFSSRSVKKCILDYRNTYKLLAYGNDESVPVNAEYVNRVLDTLLSAIRKELQISE